MSRAFPRMLSNRYCVERGPPKDFEIKFVLNNGRNKFSFMWITIFLHSRELNLKCYSLEWRNVVTHGQLKENLYIHCFDLHLIVSLMFALFSGNMVKVTYTYDRIPLSTDTSLYLKN